MSTAPSLSGPFLKLLRAEEHLDRFSELSDPFVEKETQRIQKRYHKDAGVLIFELDPSPTPPQWGPIIGDCLFDCRSSLDQFANQLAGGDPNDRDTAFPICLDPAAFAGKKTQRELARMSLDAVALVEEAQPYQGDRTTHPEYDALWVLHDLCNIDKHRSLHFTSLGFDGATYVGDPQIAGLHFGLMASTGTIQLAAVNVSSPDEEPPLTLHLEIAFADVLLWKMPVGVSRFLEDVIALIRAIFGMAVKRGLVTLPLVSD